MIMNPENCPAVDSTKPTTSFDDVLARLQKLTVPSQSSTSLNPSYKPSAPQKSALTLDTDGSRTALTHGECTLHAPSSISYGGPTKEFEEAVPTIIDTFAPRPFPSDLSPTSSSSSDLESVSSQRSISRSSLEAFLSSRSRVVRLYNLPAMADMFLASLFFSSDQPSGIVPIPVTMWVLREGYHDHNNGSVWAVFKTHQEACASLSLSGSAMSVAPALESDLEPFHKLKRLALRAPLPNHSTFSPSPPMEYFQSLHSSSSVSDLRTKFSGSDFGSIASRNDYTLSSNPPNPRTSFRLGDWICSSLNCAAHNFGRNITCIGCGCPRAGNPSTPSLNPPTTSSSRTLPSPRFASFNHVPTHTQSPPVTAPQSLSPYPQMSQASVYQSMQPTQSANKSAHPLTPSGRSFALGGKVQNISSDPLSPCIMYWPDNEPLPENGQIRPGGLAGVPPPILNTGNRGPISHQPGDWICLKCNYLNWRRRKVCQTCFPYAEGNGDSVSAAVQAERIALLSSVLAQTQFSPKTMSPAPPAARSHSLTPPQIQRPFVDVSPPQSRGPVHRSHSHVDLNSNFSQSRPIYQTSGHRQPSPLYSTSPHSDPRLHAPAPLLPSFLQDIVQISSSSAQLSPASTASADLSLEEYDDTPPSSASSSFPIHGVNNLSCASTGNIWRLDGEESKSLSSFALPHHHDLVGTVKRPSHEKLRIQVS